MDICEVNAAALVLDHRGFLLRPFDKMTAALSWVLFPFPVTKMSAKRQPGTVYTPSGGGKSYSLLSVL
ncbi:hypothetical protein ROLI_000930 [Roseobacter fucihabitans]|uniref:Uncharacterized protein n=1 Tax=Roseobacter fucihabitans TaxID=1537242 RepID=A0ABZ2BQ56_9RHOB|nr:hypothetical protein [Roseobacter litoralis]